MKKIYFKSRRAIENGITSEDVYISRRTASHKNNKHLSLTIGWRQLDNSACTEGDEGDGCPKSTAHGYYECIGGNCVFFPY